MPIPIRVVRTSHFRIGLRVIEQTRGLCNNQFGIRSDKFCRTGFDRLRSFRCFPHDKHRLAERRRFFLYAA